MLNGLPGDPVMLLSVVNTKLRDFYPSLDTMCEEMELNQKELTDKLEMIDYEYDAQKNQFVQMGHILEIRQCLRLCCGQ